MNGARDKLKYMGTASNDTFVYADVNSNLKLRENQRSFDFNTANELDALIDQQLRWLARKPTRIDVRHVNKVAWCANENNIYCGRLDIVMAGCEVSNPYKVAQYGRDRAIELFKMNTLPNFSPLQIQRLREADQLGCHCSISEQCHTDLLIDLC